MSIDVQTQIENFQGRLFRYIKRHRLSSDALDAYARAYYTHKARVGSALKYGEVGTPGYETVMTERFSEMKAEALRVLGVTEDQLDVNHF